MLGHRVPLDTTTYVASRLLFELEIWQWYQGENEKWRREWDSNSRSTLGIEILCNYQKQLIKWLLGFTAFFSDFPALPILTLANGKVSSLEVTISKASSATNCFFIDGLKLRYTDCKKGRCETAKNEVTGEALKDAPLILLSDDVIGIENTIYTSPTDISKVFSWVETYELN